MMDAGLNRWAATLFDVAGIDPLERPNMLAALARIVARLVAEGRADLLKAAKAALPRMIELERYRAERAGRGPETVDFPEAIAGLRTAIRSAEAADRAARPAAGG